MFSSDVAPCPQLIEAARNADLLLCESALLDASQDDKNPLRRGHMTAAEAGDAAREGTRYAIAHGSGSQTPTDPNNAADPAVVAVVRGAAVGVPNVRVTTTWPDQKDGTPCNDRNCTVVVDAAAPFVPLPSQYLLGGVFQITLRGGSKLVIQR